MKPSHKSVTKAWTSREIRKKLECDQIEFDMCLDERICPKCAELLDIKGNLMGGWDYKCTNSACGYTHYRYPTIVPAKG